MSSSGSGRGPDRSGPGYARQPDGPKARRDQITIRVTSEERAALASMAARLGETPTGFARKILAGVLNPEP